MLRVRLDEGLHPARVATAARAVLGGGAACEDLVQELGSMRSEEAQDVGSVGTGILFHELCGVI